MQGKNSLLWFNCIPTEEIKMEQSCLFTGVEGAEEAQKAYEALKTPDKRIHFEVPTYIKFYSIYQYDGLKFREMLNAWLETPEGENRTLETLQKKQNEILDACYKRDESGNKLRDSDEKHIFRYCELNYEPKNDGDKNRARFRKAGIHERLYQVLQQRGVISLLNIQERVGHTIAPNSIELRCYERRGLMIHPDEKQVEIKNTWDLPLGTRIKIHLTLLRLLNNGYEIEDAIKIALQSRED